MSWVSSFFGTQCIGNFIRPTVFGRPFVQVAQLSQRDRATPYVSWNLVSCCTTIRKITFH